MISQRTHLKLCVEKERTGDQNGEKQRSNGHSQALTYGLNISLVLYYCKSSLTTKEGHLLFHGIHEEKNSQKWSKSEHRWDA